MTDVLEQNQQPETYLKRPVQENVTHLTYTGICKQPLDFVLNEGHASAVEHGHYRQAAKNAERVGTPSGKIVMTIRTTA